MTKTASRLWFVALGISVGLATSAIGGGCTVAPDEITASNPGDPAVEATAQASSVAIPAAFQIVFVCFAPDGTQVGLPKSPVSACRAACPAPDTCVRCVFVNNAVDCGN